MQMLFKNEMILEVNKYPHWHLLVSGGRDSTAMTLEIHHLILEGIMHPQTIELVWTNTGLTLKRARQTLQRLVNYTGWNLIELKPFGIPINALMDAFSNIDKVKAELNAGQDFDRDHFGCCKELKEKPGRNYCRSIPSKERKNHLFFLGIGPLDNLMRGKRLAYYRNRNIWVSPNSHYAKVPYVRPFRDLYNVSLIDKTLKKYGFGEVKGSGCSICPILLLFKGWKKDPQSYARSRKFFLKHFRGMKFCGEIPIPLTEFIEIKSPSK